MGSKKDSGDIVAGCIALAAILLLVLAVFVGLVGGAVAGLYYMQLALQAGAVFKASLWGALSFGCLSFLLAWGVNFLKGA